MLSPISVDWVSFIWDLNREDTQPCPWIPDHWLSYLQTKMHQLQLTIHYSAWTLPLLLTDNCHLMEDFLDQGYPHHNLEWLSTCHMYLQVITLAEIMDHVGDELLSQALSSPTNPIPKGLDNISFSTLSWPDIHLLSVVCWHLWPNTIYKLYTGSSKGTWLTHPLGKWHAVHNQTHSGTGTSMIPHTLSTSIQPLSTLIWCSQYWDNALW